MSHPVSEKSALVVSAHSLLGHVAFTPQFGGLAALAKGQTDHMDLIALQGMQGLWRKGNMTEEAVKQVRREEAQAAAEILGASVEFL
jgi:4-oxalomesaconate hydratase